METEVEIEVSYEVKKGRITLEMNPEIAQAIFKTLKKKEVVLQLLEDGFVVSDGSVMLTPNEHPAHLGYA